MFKKMKNKVKSTPLYLRVERAMLIFAVTMQCAMIPIVSYALENVQLVKGTRNLLNDGTFILMGFEAGVVVVCCAIEGFKWKFGQEEAKSKHINNIKSTLGMGVFIISLTGIVPAIFSYYTTPAK